MVQHSGHPPSRLEFCLCGQPCGVSDGGLWTALPKTSPPRITPPGPDYTATSGGCKTLWRQEIEPVAAEMRRLRADCGLVSVTLLRTNIAAAGFQPGSETLPLTCFQSVEAFHSHADRGLVGFASIFQILSPTPPGRAARQKTAFPEQKTELSSACEKNHKFELAGLGQGG